MLLISEKFSSLPTLPTKFAKFLAREGIILPSFARSPRENTANTLITHQIFWLVPLAFVSLPLVATVVFAQAELLPRSIYDLSDGFGPLVKNMVSGNGYVVCKPEDLFTVVDGVCFRAHRMPLVPAFTAILVMLLGDQVTIIHLIKALIWALPVGAAVIITLNFVVKKSSRIGVLVCTSLLCAPLLIPNYLVETIHMQVEEGYSYSLVGLCFALLLFPDHRRNLSSAIILGTAISLLYLTKSSMIVVCILFMVFYCVFQPNRKRCAVVLILASLGPEMWIGYTAHYTGQASYGTSWDGVNFFKGENPKLLDRYPPRDGGALDRWDEEFFADHVFLDEWDGDRYYKSAATQFILNNPGKAITLAARKFDVLFLSVQKFGGAPYKGMLGTVDFFSLYLVRILELAAIAAVVRLVIWRQPMGASAALLFMATCGAIAAPYLAGFAWTRHMSPLIFPIVLFLCYVVAVVFARNTSGSSPLAEEKDRRTPACQAREASPLLHGLLVGNLSGTHNSGDKL